MIKNIFYFILLYSSFIWTIFASNVEDKINTKDPTILKWILPKDSSIIATNENGFTMLDTIFNFAKDSIFWLLMLISIWVFLYIWMKLVTVRGNPEEFKKAMMQIVYAVVWIAIISLSWAWVKLVSGLNF